MVVRRLCARSLSTATIPITRSSRSVCNKNTAQDPRVDLRLTTSLSTYTLALAQAEFFFELNWPIMFAKGQLITKGHIFEESLGV